MLLVVSLFSLNEHESLTAQNNYKNHRHEEGEGVSESQSNPLEFMAKDNITTLHNFSSVKHFINPCYQAIIISAITH